MHCAQPFQFALHARKDGRPGEMLQPLMRDLALVLQSLEEEALVPCGCNVFRQFYEWVQSRPVLHTRSRKPGGSMGAMTFIGDAR